MNKKKRFARSKVWIKARFFSSFFYAVCRISPAAAASMDKRTRHCCILCRVEPRVTPGTPQRPYQNNKSIVRIGREQLRRPGGAEVSLSVAPSPPLSLRLQNTSACHTQRCQEDWGVSDAPFPPMSASWLEAQIARHCVLKNILLDWAFWYQDACYIQTITFVSWCKIVYLASLVM